MTVEERDLDRAAAALGAAARRRGVWVGVAESLTGGMVVSALARAEAASDWLRGGVVSYDRHVKHDLLDVPPGPVVSRMAASAMAASARRVLGADLALAVTGAGGPDGQDGEPPGSVWFAVAGDGPIHAVHRHLPGEPAEVCAAAALAAIELATAHLDDHADLPRP